MLTRLCLTRCQSVLRWDSHRFTLQTWRCSLPRPLLDLSCMIVAEPNFKFRPRTTIVCTLFSNMSVNNSSSGDFLHFHFSCQWLDTLSCVHRSCRDGHGKRYRSTYICTYICNSKFRGWCSHQAHLLLAHIKTLTLLVETIFPLSLLTIWPFVLRY